MSRKFFSGTTLEQAVLSAARHYEIEPERVAYSTRDKRHGFVNVRKKFVIEVDPSAPERAKGDEVPWEPKLAGRPAKPATSSAPAPSAAPPKTGAPAEKRPPKGSATKPPRETERPAPSRAKIEIEPVAEDPLEAADLALEDLADLLMFDVEWEICLNDDESITIELSGDDGPQIVADDGQILRSIEHLIPRMIRGKLGRSVICSIDCEGFKADHETYLQEFAIRAAKEVRETQEPQLLEPMTPADRRLVHIALEDDPSVVTESEGYGFTKQVKILPA